jgi:1,2-diacylglycerol 3-alpha-glucosyltransferase
MKIGIFTNNYLPNPYGVTCSVESFRKEFEKRGHSVFIFAPYFKGYTDKNPSVFRYPALDIEFKIKFPIAIPYSKRMDKIIQNLNLDIIHSQHPNLLGSAAAKWARKKKIPLVFTWHTLYDQYAHFAKIVPRKIAAWYIIKKAMNFANRADAVVVPTDSIIPIIKNWGVKNNNIVPVASGVEEFDFNNPDKKIVRKKYNISNDETVLLLVSRLTAEKNVEFVFRSLKNILKEKKAKLLVVSDGNLLPDLKKFCEKEKISDKVIFCGVIGRDQMKNYYAAADIFVYGSKSETQGMIVSEAMYMGLPIVALGATGINSLVLHNGNGFLIKEDEKEFERAVLKLIDDKNLRAKFGAVSGKIAGDYFTSSICAEKMLDVYKRAIENYSK